MPTPNQIVKQRELRDKEIKLQLERELYKLSFFEFFKKAVTVLEPANDFDFNWHHKYICDLLQVEIERITNKKPKTHDFNINVVPRSSKSLMVSVCLNAWAWTINPYLQFLVISHSDGLAVTLAQKTKDLIESKWYKTLYPDIQIRTDSTAKSHFENVFGGTRVSTSIGASITGANANVIILDDPTDANNVSDIILNNCISKYKDSIFNRLNNPTVDLRIILGQRIHSNDLSGWIKANDTRGKYKSIVLPMELTEDVEPVELKEKYQHGVLWNSRFPIDVIPDLTNSEYVYNCQYLMKPAIVGGGILKKDWFQVLESVPNDITYHFFIDSAQTKDIKKNDPTTILIAGTKDNNVYIKQSIQVWLEFPDLIKKIIELSIVYGSAGLKIYFEPKSNGKDLVSSLKRETLLNVIELTAPTQSKMSRTISITPKVETGRVKLLRGQWVDNYLDELSIFPLGRNDGQVDTTVYAVQTLLTNQNNVKWYM